MTARLKFALIGFASVIIGVAAGYLIITPNLVQTEQDDYIKEVQIQYEQYDNTLGNFIDNIDYGITELSKNPNIYVDSNEYTSFLTAKDDAFIFDPTEKEQELIDLFFIYMNSSVNIDSAYIGFAESKTFIRSEPIQLSSNVGEGFNYDPTTRSWYINALEQQGEIAFNNIDKHPTEEVYYSTISRAIYDNNDNLVGVIGVDIELSSFVDNFIVSASLDDGNYYYIQDDNVVTFSDTGEIIITKVSDVFDNLEIEDINQTGMSQFEQTVDDKKSLVISYSVTDTNIIFLNIIPIKDISSIALTSVTEVRNLFIFITLILLVILLLAANQTIIKPLFKLESTLKEFTLKEDMDFVFPVKGNDEFAQINSTLNNMLKTIDEKNYNMSERMKELRCLYTVAKSARRRDTLEDVFKDTLDAVIKGWQYPDITCSKIEFEGETFKSKDFIESKWHQSANIVSNDVVSGTVNVYYKKQMPELDEGPFMKEERDLINSIAQTINMAIKSKNFQDGLRKRNENFETELKLRTKELKEREENLDSIFNSSLDAIMVVDLESGKYVASNNAALEMFEIDSNELENVNSKDLAPEYQPNGKLSSEVAKENTKITLASKGYKVEWLARTLKGRLFPAHLSLSTTMFQNRQAINVIVRDITESKKIDKQEKATVKLMKDLMSVSTMEEKLKLITITMSEMFDAEFSRIWMIGDGKLCENCAHLIGEEDNYDFKKKLDCINIMTTKNGYEKYIPEMGYIVLGKTTMGRVLQEEISPFYTNDIRNDKRINGRGDMPDEPLKSYAVQVIRYPNGEVAGVYDIFGTSLLTESDYTRLSSLSNITGQVIAAQVAKQEIEEAKIIAENATKAKSDFLANMSHEIRTPMNAIIGLTNLLDKTTLNNKQQDYVTKTSRAAKNLLGIINDILDFSKIEAGKLDIERIEFNLDETLDNISSVVGLKAFENGIEFIIAKNYTLPNTLIGDPLRIGQVLTNLANNAIKFTSDGQVLLSIDEVSSREKFVTLKFEVKDTGIGMTEEQVNKLFKAFSQADTSTTRKYGGTGLGLSISKNLVEKMGGNIYVSSVYGKGSTFGFEIEFELGQKTKLRRMVVPKGIQNIKALVVDDNEDARIVAKTYLDGFGIKSILAASGEEALKKIDKTINLVLLDWKMPGLNGTETWIEMKQLLDYTPKVIMVTAYGKDAVLKTAEDVGINEIVMKPVSQSHLFNSILKVFGEELHQDISTSKTQSFQLNELIKGASILVAEDNEINQQVAKETLENEGFYVDIAADGKEARDMVVANNYDLIFMDLQMPVMSGYEASRAIRDLGNAYKDIPIIALSADAMSGIIEKVKDAGMNDFVSKPIITQELFKALNNWVKPKSGRVTNLQNVINRNIIDYSVLTRIDFKDGLNRVANNELIYLDILKKYVDNYRDFPQIITEKLQSKDTSLARDLHTLKGVSGNIGAKDTHLLVKQIEKAYKTNGNNISTEKINLLSDSITLDVKDIEPVLINKIESNNEKRILNSTQLLEKLKELIEQLDDYSTESEETLETLAATFDSMNIEYTTLKNDLANYNYDSAIDEVKEILQNIKGGK